MPELRRKDNYRSLLAVFGVAAIVLEADTVSEMAERFALAVALLAVLHSVAKANRKGGNGSLPKG